MTDAVICAYCARPTLRADDPPEHVVPAALGASFTVNTVCRTCNTWASANVDGPFLRDEFVLLLRHSHDVRAPGPNGRGERVPNPLLKGFTKDGAYAHLRDNGELFIAPRIVRKDDGKTIEIHANTTEEAHRLAEREKKRLAEVGTEFEMGDLQAYSIQPEITGTANANFSVWGRLAAKIGLAVGSDLLPASWRLSEGAEDLRRVLHGEPSTWLGEGTVVAPTRLPEELAVAISTPPVHLVWTQHTANGVAGVVVTLFGELTFGVPLGVFDQRIPNVAWRLDPAHPRRDGQTNFEGLVLPYLERLAAEEDERQTGDQPHGDEPPGR